MSRCVRVQHHGQQYFISKSNLKENPKDRQVRAITDMCFGAVNAGPAVLKPDVLVPSQLLNKL